MICLDYVKRCSHCRAVLPADVGDELAAGFWVAQRYPGGRVRYHAWCKDCQRVRMREYARRRRRSQGVRENPPRWLVEVDGRLVLFRKCVDCGEEGPCADSPDSMFPRYRRSDGTIVWRARCNRCINRRRRAQYGRRVGEMRELSRMRERLLAERRGHPLPPPRETVIDGTRPECAAAPFVAWLAAYQQARGLSASELALELGLVERRTRSLLAGGQASVSVDVVSRALTEARVVVSVGGRTVVTFDDLYPGTPLRERRRQKGPATVEEYRAKRRERRAA